MSVDVKLIGFVGIKVDYNSFYFVKNSADPDLKDVDINDYKQVVYTDYLPSDFVYGSDGMCGSYSYIGKKLFYNRDLYDGVDFSIDIDKLQKICENVYLDLKSAKVECEPKDVKLYVFTEFN